MSLMRFRCWRANRRRATTSREWARSSRAPAYSCTRTPATRARPISSSPQHRSDILQQQEEARGTRRLFADDTNVILLVSNPGLQSATVTTPVETAQVAPTILEALGFDPGQLQAVQAENTPLLPGLFF
jgi:hypothetical protein